uniref:Uncharacterized protein n=1 Tax=Lepeophtheirus salmonis TaxID=72036 RepID=A0A0K2TZ50_LEPSM
METSPSRVGIFHVLVPNSGDLAQDQYHNSGNSRHNSVSRRPCTRA